MNKDKVETPEVLDEDVQQEPVATGFEEATKDMGVEEDV